MELRETPISKFIFARLMRQLFTAEKEFEVDRTLAVRDDHHIVASLVATS